jgi:hypothetical protein
MTSVERNWDDYGEITTENRMSDKNPPAKADGFLPVGGVHRQGWVSMPVIESKGAEGA